MALPNPAMNFTAFDILTAAEMNDLVENIEALSDGSGFEISNPITAASGSHISLVAGTSKLVKTTILRQNDTTNGYQSGNTVFLTGWGVITPGVAASGSETVTFGVTFLQRPIVTISPGGDNASATTYGSGGVNIKDILLAQAHTITTTTFVAKVESRDATNFSAGNTVFYQWVAIGEIA